MLLSGTSIKELVNVSVPYIAGILRQSLSIVNILGELFCLPEIASWEFFQWCCSKNSNWKRAKAYTLSL